MTFDNAPSLVVSIPQRLVVIDSHVVLQTALANYDQYIKSANENTGYSV